MLYEPVWVNAALLDTHTVIWMVTEEEMLGEHARDVLFDSNIRKFISPATYWEMAIKIKSGKLEISIEYDKFFTIVIAEYGLEILHIHPRHTSMLTSLHLFHKDPFDRLMIAQASIEGSPIISVDNQFDKYPVERWWNYATRDLDEENGDDQTTEDMDEVNDGELGE
jgi:PIN domain nuclease of toxin-antitoxin system